MAARLGKYTLRCLHDIQCSFTRFFFFFFFFISKVFFNEGEKVVFKSKFAHASKKSFIFFSPPARNTARRNELKFFVALHGRHPSASG